MTHSNTLAPSHIIGLQVSEAAAASAPELVRNGKRADYVTVDTTDRVPEDGALMVATMEEADGSTFPLIGKVERRGRWFYLRGVRFTKDDPAWLGTVTGVYFNVRNEVGDAAEQVTGASLAPA